MVGLVLSSEEKVRLSRDFEESKVARAVAVLKQRKNPPDSTMGFLIMAIKKDYKPFGTENKTEQLSMRGANNKESIFKFKRTFSNELSLKDIAIDDMLDHVRFNKEKVLYESDTFGKEIYKILEKLNLEHLVGKPKTPDLTPLQKLLNEQAQKMRLPN